MNITGRGKMLKIYLGETEKWHGKTLYHQVVMKLREEGLAGATVYRGILGYGADKVIHSAKILDLSADLPMVIDVIDSEENIMKVLPVIREMVPRGLIIVVDIDIVQYGPYGTGS